MPTDDIFSEKEVQPLMSSVSVSAMPILNEPEKLLKQVVNINSKKVFLEPSCPICISHKREEIDNKIIENPYKLQDIQSFISQNFNIDISADLIQNHYENHYSRRLKEINKSEYVAKIGRMTASATTMESLELLGNILLERLVEANSIPSSAGDLIDVEETKTKQTSTLMNQYKWVLTMKANLLGEMKVSGEVISIPKDAFVDIFKKAALEVSKTDGERKIVKFISDSMQKSMQS